MSFLSVQCIPSASCPMEYSIPHLPTVMGVHGPSGVPGSDEGLGEAENRCRYPSATGSSILTPTRYMARPESKGDGAHQFHSGPWVWNEAPPPPQTHYINDYHYGLPVLGSWVLRTQNWPCNKQQHMYARHCLPTWCSGAPAWACTAKLALSAFDIYDTISAVSPHKINAQTKHTILNTYIQLDVHVTYWHLVGNSYYYANNHPLSFAPQAAKLCITSAPSLQPTHIHQIQSTYISDSVSSGYTKQASAALLFIAFVQANVANHNPLYIV